MLIALIVFMILSVVMSIWALVINFKRSIVGGLLTLFLGLPILYYLVIGWGKEGETYASLFPVDHLLCHRHRRGVKYAFNAGDEFKQIDMSAPAARRLPCSPNGSDPGSRKRASQETPPPRPAAAPQFPAQRAEPVRTAREEPRRPKAAQAIASTSR